MTLELPVTAVESVIVLPETVCASSLPQSSSYAYTTILFSTGVSSSVITVPALSTSFSVLVTNCADASISPPVISCQSLTD